MRRFLLIIPLLALIVSCSSGVSSGFFVVIDGKWVGTLFSNPNLEDPIRYSGNVIMDVTQNETTNSLSGIVSISDPETLCWVGGIIDPTASSVTGSKVIIVIEDNGGATLVIEGDATTSTISAIYTNSGSGGETCMDHSGKFTATRSG